MKLKKTLICLSMPNTAGTLMRRTIASVYEPKEMFHIRAVEKPNIDLFKSLSDDDKNRIKCVKGDVFTFGIHENLPQSFTYITLMHKPTTSKIENEQTKRIAGVSLDEKCTKKTLTQAKSNIRKYFSVVGLNERFDETILVLEKKFGWKLEYITHPPILEVEMVEKGNKYDVELYSYAKKRFEKEVKKLKE